LPVEYSLPHRAVTSNLTSYLSNMSESLNLEAVIGFEGKVTDGMQYVSRDDGEYLIYAMGSTVVVKNIADNTQSFMQGHSNEVCCLAVSNDGKKVVSGQNNLKQRGSTADAIIWDLDAVIARRQWRRQPRRAPTQTSIAQGQSRSRSLFCLRSVHFLRWWTRRQLACGLGCRNWYRHMWHPSTHRLYPCCAVVQHHFYPPRNLWPFPPQGLEI